MYSPADFKVISNKTASNSNLLSGPILHGAPLQSASCNFLRPCVCTLYRLSHIERNDSKYL